MAKREEPPLEYRPVFVQYIKKQKCRYNPSFSGMLDLPPAIRQSVLVKWEERHPRMHLPDLKLSKPPERKKRK